jgi:hypothetical protein
LHQLGTNCNGQNLNKSQVCGVLLFYPLLVWFGMEPSLI